MQTNAWFSSDQERRKHLLPIFFTHLRGIGRHTGLGFEPITAFRAGPKINNQILTNEFRPIRRNQGLTTFWTGCHHGDLLSLFLFSASRVGSFIIVTVAPMRGSALIQIKNEAVTPNLQYRSIAHSIAALRVLVFLMPTPSVHPIEEFRTAWQFLRA